MENRKPAIDPSRRVVSFRKKGWIEPVSIFPALAMNDGFIWLDSSLNDPLYGGWSYMMPLPFMTLSGEGNLFRLKEGETRTVHEGDPFDALDNILRRFKSSVLDDATPPFTGGAVGFFGYGLLRFTEPSARLTRGTHPPGEGDLWIGFYDRVFAFDHGRKEMWLIVNHDHGFDPAPILDDLERMTREAVRRDGGAVKADNAGQRELKIECPFTKESYVDAVERVRLYIERGDILQANISRKISARGSFDPVSLYLRLRSINPAPFAAYVNGGAFRILSSSPERFMRLKDGQAQTRPIKGTRPRGRDVDADNRLRHELSASEKDRAENVMIVDLMRNDLSKVCQPFTVNVPELCAVEKFATVFHLTSTVEGKLKPGLTPVDLIRASFPPGSVTGAPKLRALEIIDEVEPDPRGAYCGSIGWIGFDGSLDMSVAIRIMVHTDEGVRLHSGGGVTYPSRPEDEYDETTVKAGALLEALLKS